MQIDSENSSVIMANGNTILQLFLDSNRRETVYVNIFLTINGKSDSTSVLFKKQ